MLQLIRQNISLFGLVCVMMAGAFLAIVSTAHAQQTKVTVLVDDAYPPFSYQVDGEGHGLYIQVMRAAFARMPEFDVTLRPVPWQRGKRLMETGEYLGLAPAFFHGHDWPYLHPYSLPFYVETIRAVCHQGLLAPPKNPPWPSGFRGLRVGNVSGFDGWGGQAFRDLVAQGSIEYFESSSSAKLIQMAMLGRLDCILMENKAFDLEYPAVIADFTKRNKSFTTLRKGPITNTDPVYIGYSRPAREAGKFPYMFDFMQAFDSAIYAMQKDNSLEQLMQQAN